MDYTTTADVFTYGDVAAPSANQTAVMNKIVTAVSSRVDKICSMNFSYGTYTNRRVPVRVGLDGLLTIYVNSPNITTLTSASLRVGNLSQLLPISIANAVEEEYVYGTKVLFFGLDYYNVREVSMLRAYLSYSGGWTTLAAVPTDFELAVRRFCWYVYQQRATPMNSTAVPELGIITLPASIQPDIMDVLKRYAWWWS
jgi:hypothetical protein